MEIGNLTSIAQLACAYTLILGGYSTFRIKKEEDAEKILDRAYEQLAEMMSKTNAPELTGDHDRQIRRFEIIDWKSTPFRLLNRHRSFARGWYYRQKKIRKSRDVCRGLVLAAFGVISLFLLFFSSLNPEFRIDSRIGWFLAIFIWVPPLIAMGQIWWEDSQLARQIYGNSPDNRVSPKKQLGLSQDQDDSEEETTETISNDWPHPGHLYALANNIDREYRVFRERLWSKDGR